MQKINRDLIRLKDILNTILEIEKINGREKYQAYAAAYLVAVIGEAANHISMEIREKHAYIPWSKITGMRNKIIHEYGKLDEIILWNVVDNELQILKKQITGILETL